MINIKISPVCINVKLNIEDTDDFFTFAYCLYLSLDTKMNANISQMYKQMYETKLNNKNDLFEYVKKHKNWKYIQMLATFNGINFVEIIIQKIGLSSLLNITNDLILKLKNKDVNTNSKMLKFVDKEMSSEQDIIDFYNNFSQLFMKKAEELLHRIEYMISEVIEDLNGNRPFNEYYRACLSDDFSNVKCPY